MRNEEKIQNLRNIIVKQLIPLINSDYVLLDVPSYGNIGDHLIYEGETIFLKKYLSNYKCKYSCNAHDFIPTKINKEIILFQGGGNFGDIYDIHQDFRKNVIKRFLNNRIIIFPQTVFYKNQEKLKADCNLLIKHPDLYICVRDLTSYNLLKNYISENKLLLLPDMAFFIDFSNLINHNQEKNALFMNRVDVENVELNASINNNLIEQGYKVDIKDWPTFYDTPSVKFYNYYNSVRTKLIRILANMNIVKPDLNDRILKRHYLKMGVDFMNKYDFVATTRLHGLILGILLEKKLIVLDNNYGKLSSFYKEWLVDFDNIELKK